MNKLIAIILLTIAATGCTTTSVVTAATPAVTATTSAWEISTDNTGYPIAYAQDKETSTILAFGYQDSEGCFDQKLLLASYYRDQDDVLTEGESITIPLARMRVDNNNVWENTDVKAQYRIPTNSKGSYLQMIFTPSDSLLAELVSGESFIYTDSLLKQTAHYSLQGTQEMVNEVLSDCLERAKEQRAESEWGDSTVEHEWES